MKESDLKYPVVSGNPMKLDLSRSRPLFPKPPSSITTLGEALKKDGRTLESIAQTFKESI